MHATDNVELDPPKVSPPRRCPEFPWNKTDGVQQKRYEEFMRAIRLWKHLHLLKRGGIGMLPGGIGAAAVGSCAVECPACPRELPPHWRQQR